MDSSSLETLLERWSEAREQGRDLPAVELCRDHPELADELERRIAECRRMSELMRQLVTPTLYDLEQTVVPQPLTPGSPPLPKSLSALVRRRSGEQAVKVPGYEILRELGRGGMGVVYLARDLELDRLVAVKMLLESACVGEESVGRFRQEALAVARLSHPGTVQIYKVGEIHSPSGGPRPYMTMEYCAGGNLQERLAGKPLPAREAGHVVESLARTMHAVHQANVIHRDLKPGNVLLASPVASAPGGLPPGANATGLAGNAAKITDFGLAKRLDYHDSSLSGLVLGTPSYMAPEQAEGRTREVGPLADVWALGAILYECLTGRPPFLGATVLETLQQVTRHDPVAPRELNPTCPRDLEIITLKCLQKDRGKRYPSAAALADDLERFRLRRPILARPAGFPERLAKWVVRCPYQSACAVSALIGLAAVVVALLLHGAEYRRLDRVREDFTRCYSAAEAKAGRAGSADVKLWDEIKTELQSALDRIAKEPAFADFALRDPAQQLRDRALDMLAQDRLRDESRKKLAKAWGLHAEAVFFGQLAVGLDLPDSRQRARRAIAEVLELFAAPLDGSEGDRVAALCHELLLLDADLIAQEDPRGAQLRRDRAEHLGVSECAGSHFRAALEHYRREKYTHALESLGKALDREPKHHGAGYLRAVCLLHLNKPEQARDALTRALEQVPGIAWTWLLRGHAEMEMGNPDAARDNFEEAARLSSDPLAAYVVRVNRGVLAMKRRAWAEATNDFRVAIQQRPEALPAYVNLALTLRQSVAWPAWQTAVVGVGPQGAFALLAVEAHRRGALGEAVVALDAAIARHPSVGRLYHERGRLHLARDDHFRARDDMARAVALAAAAGQTATLAEDLVELGRLLHRSGQHGKAAEAYRQAVALAPKQMLAQRLLAEPLVALGRYREAGQALDAYLGAVVVTGQPIAPEQSTRLARTLEARGLIHVHQGDFRSAIDVYTQSLKLARDAGVLRLRGWAYLKLGSARLAEADFADAIALSPVHPEAYLGRAESRVRQGSLDRALADVEQGLQLAPMTTRLLFNAARVRAQVALQLPRSGAKNEEIRAARLLDRALNLLSGQERLEFWRQYVEADANLAAVRLHPLLSRHRPTANHRP